MARSNTQRTLSVVPQQPIIDPPQRFPVSKQHEYINDQMEEKAAIAAGEAAVGAFGVAVNTAMTLRNADTTVRGVTALEGMRPHGGTTRGDKVGNQAINDFQIDLADANRAITGVVTQNIAQAVNRPYQKPQEETREASGWVKLLALDEKV